MPRRKAPSPKSSAPSPDDISDKELADILHEMRIDASGPSELTSEDVDVWVKASGWTPVEFLTHTYRNPFQKMEHRISAAKAVLEYAHRKLPQKLQLEQSGEIGVRSLDAAALAKLSPKELDTLEKILEKVA